MNQGRDGVSPVPAQDLSAADQLQLIIGRLEDWSARCQLTTRVQRAIGDLKQTVLRLRLLDEPADIDVAAADVAGTRRCEHDLDISPTGHLACCRLCGFVGRWRDGMWERVSDRPGPPAYSPVIRHESTAPLATLGQGDFEKHIRPADIVGRRLDARG